MGAGDSDGQNSDHNHSNSTGTSPKNKKVQNVYPSRAYKIARVNSLAPSVSGSIQNGLDQYHSSSSVYKKSRRKNKTYSGQSSPGTATCNSSTVGSVICDKSSNSGRSSSNNSVNSKTQTNHSNNMEPSITSPNGRIIHGSRQNLGQKSPITDQTDAASHVSETMSGVSDSKTSQRLPIIFWLNLQPFENVHQTKFSL